LVSGMSQLLLQTLSIHKHADAVVVPVALSLDSLQFIYSYATMRRLRYAMLASGSFEHCT
jgi:hypothetical protein